MSQLILPRRRFLAGLAAAFAAPAIVRAESLMPVRALAPDITITTLGWSDPRGASGLANTTYHLFRVYNSKTGADDFFATPDPNPNPPGGFDEAYRMGAIRTDPQGAVVRFRQKGPMFRTRPI
jgi:hypothetical protein